LGALLTSWLGVTETNFDNLWLLVLIANSSTLLPLIFISWLPAKDPQIAEAETSNGQILEPAEVIEQNKSISLDKQGYFPNVIPEFVIQPATEAKKD
jgi:hypothetical protein